jgi:hypothetical protein
MRGVATILLSSEHYPGTLVIMLSLNIFHYILDLDSHFAEMRSCSMGNIFY